MARNIVPEMLKYQQENKKVRKGSTCEYCNDLNKFVKLKQHTITKESVIICKDCFGILWVKHKQN